MNNLNNSKPTRLSKVYFTWVIRDFGSAEWFHSLLQAIEEQDTSNRIEINIYLTAKIKEDDMNNIIVRGTHFLSGFCTNCIFLRSKMSVQRKTLSLLCVLPLISAGQTGTGCSVLWLKSTPKLMLAWFVPVVTFNSFAHQSFSSSSVAPQFSQDSSTRCPTSTQIPEARVSSLAKVRFYFPSVIRPS
jgi:hypothetical protein